MAKRIYIGGRLESVEQGNVVTGANAILDDTKGKKQNVINSETDAELLRLQNEKQDNLTFDNAPTENSNNPVKSGGVYTANLALQAAIEVILLLIPNAASALNKLVDEAQMNDKISTASATFRGTYTSVQALDNVQGDANDYAYVSTTDAAGNSTYDKYKYVEGTGWVFEYKLNNNAFTATEWAAIQSGITAALVGKLTDLPTAEQLITTFAGKQDVLTFDDAPTLGSNNPVKSSGIKTELNTKQPTLVVGTNLDASPTEDSTNPVTSGGVWAAINAIAVKISAEASSSNQLADKAWVVSSIAAAILAAIPSFKGQFTSLADLLLVESPKAGDLGIVRTTDSDGYAVFTIYQFLNDTWNVFYTLSHHNLKKPATTGITGEYPYNGMGKIVLDKNIVSGVNTLTQDMFYKGEVGSRVPNTNTIFVIQYDYELAEDITIPDGCVLQFEGGSIKGKGSNKDTIIFSYGVIIDGKFNNCSVSSPVPTETNIAFYMTNCEFAITDDRTTISIIGKPEKTIKLDKIRILGDQTHSINGIILGNPDGAAGSANVTIENSYIFGCTYAVSMYNGCDCIDIHSCHFFRNLHDVSNVTSGSKTNLSIYDNHFQGAPDNAECLKIGGRFADIHNNIFEVPNRNYLTFMHLYCTQSKIYNNFFEVSSHTADSEVIGILIDNGAQNNVFDMLNFSGGIDYPIYILASAKYYNTIKTILHQKVGSDTFEPTYLITNELANDGFNFYIDFNIVEHGISTDKLCDNYKGVYINGNMPVEKGSFNFYKTDSGSISFEDIYGEVLGVRLKLYLANYKMTDELVLSLDNIGETGTLFEGTINYALEGPTTQDPTASRQITFTIPSQAFNPSISYKIDAYVLKNNIVI